MINKLYSIYDKTTKSFQRVFPCVNDGQAMQIFQQIVNEDNKNNVYLKHPEQFFLAYMGQFDDNTGKLTQDETGYKPLIEATEVLEEPNQRFTLKELFNLYDKHLETKVTNINEAKS